MWRLKMKEHVLVFDYPQTFGKDIPEYYHLQVFDVPNDKKKKIMKLLKHLGFVGIKDGFIDRQLSERRGIERDLCSIHAQYYTRAAQAEYLDFWEKKETIELEIDEF
jgi:hypothetical protein